MTETSLVTLVTPTFNQASFLGETLDSVLAQTHPAIEYIVIDDGSTDHTADVLARYAGRVNTRRQDNIGQARTLNRAWEEARGRYIGYLSSDDLLLPDAIARMATVLDANPDVVCAFPNSDLIDLRSRILRRGVCRPFDLAKVVVEQECSIGPGALFRRDAFDAIGGWRPEMRLGPDREFWIRLAAVGRFHFDTQSLALYRTHVEATSFRAASEEVSHEFVRVLDEFYRREPVPPALLSRRDEAYAQAAMLLSRNALWRGDFRLARDHYRRACTLHPPLSGWRHRLRLLRQGLSKPLKVLHARLTQAG